MYINYDEETRKWSAAQYRGGHLSLTISEFNQRILDSNEEVQVDFEEYHKLMDAKILSESVAEFLRAKDRNKKRRGLTR